MTKTAIPNIAEVLALLIQLLVRLNDLTRARTNNFRLHPTKRNISENCRDTTQGDDVLPVADFDHGVGVVEANLEDVVEDLLHVTEQLHQRTIR